MNVLSKFWFWFWFWFWFGLGALCLVESAGVAGPDQTGSCALEQGRSGVVSRVMDGDTLQLEDGLIVRLIGAAAPKQAMKRDAAGAVENDTADIDRLSEQAREALEKLVLGREIQIFFGGTRSDRHHRSLAHIFVSDGENSLWIQEVIVGAGLARVYSYKDNRACIRALQQAESVARANELGIWKNSEFAVQPAHPPAGLLGLTDTFQIIEGRVVSAHAVNNRVFLNFGKIWREDFTGSISSRDYAKFRDAGLDLVALEGRIVRIRGWIEERGGPMIVLTHPEQLELAGDASDAN
ncbi:MAG: thermonuclease family protein [Fimbriimonadaceae bacterium]|nr:thermonuclease family protein [Alphaproteobacteria bacterium]